MSGLRETLAHYQSLRRTFENQLVASRPGSSSPDANTAQAGTRLCPVPAFGTNPGDLRMLVHAPAALHSAPALVVALHGCGQSAAEFAAGTGWSTLADRYGFVVVYPEQASANNPNSCFSWFQPGDISRHGGEARSIQEMVEHVIQAHGVDRRKIFVTGLSAGGAMACAMLATYPEVYAGGAIVAGLPYGSASSVQEAFEAMFSEQFPSDQELGDRVRAASAHTGPCANCLADTAGLAQHLPWQANKPTASWHKPRFRRCRARGTPGCRAAGAGAFPGHGTAGRGRTIGRKRQ